MHELAPVKPPSAHPNGTGNKKLKYYSILCKIVFILNEKRNFCILPAKIAAPLYTSENETWTCIA